MAPNGEFRGESRSTGDGSRPRSAPATSKIFHGEGESGGGGHGGTGAMRWLLTYADMITLLMVFFIVLYAISNVDAQKYEALANALRTAFYAGNSLMPLPGGGSSSAGEGSQDPMVGLGSAVAGELESAIKAGEASVTVSDRGLVVSLLGTALFDLGQANIRDDSKPVLDRVSKILAGVTNNISVEGSTDDLPINTPEFPSNWELSTRRATNVVQYFIDEAGLDAKRLMVVGWGEVRPLFVNNSEENRRKNRRVDIIILRKSPVRELGKEIPLPRGSSNGGVNGEGSLQGQPWDNTRLEPDGKAGVQPPGPQSP